MLLDADDEPAICPDCDGSGEGRTPTLLCRRCHGCGMFRSDDGAEPDYEEMLRDREESHLDS